MMEFDVLSDDCKSHSVARNIEVIELTVRLKHVVSFVLRNSWALVGDSNT